MLKTVDTRNARLVHDRAFLLGSAEIHACKRGQRCKPAWDQALAKLVK